MWVKMEQRAAHIFCALTVYFLLPLIIQGKAVFSNWKHGRIINGENAQKHEFPWMVMLTDPFGVQFCGGALISEDFVLTAAHCMLGDPEWNPSAVQVKLGVHNKSENEPESYFAAIRHVIRHPNYVTEGIVSDIALLQLTKKIDFTKAVTPICIPSEEDTFTGVTGTIAGWGLTSEGGEGSNVLQKADVPVLTQSDCKDIYGDVITDDMVCAGGQGRDTCQKDSGGPIMLNDPEDGWVLIGVTSWGEGCGRKPGVFSRASFAAPWIRKNVGEPSLCLK